jgi:hypothetical protein
MMKRHAETAIEERKMVLEMIETSWELAERPGKHPRTQGCNRITCVDKRKRVLGEKNREWEFEI